MTAITREDVLEYHRKNRPGKIGVALTKPMATQRDLSLAYTPGVAEPVRLIAELPELAYRYTAKGNLVGVITNGTAVLGLGNQGALASKPVMEGKAALFKRFADIDVFDIEINETNPKKLVEIIAALAPTFGGINLEDIKAPECFYVERELRERLDIPVFHDDQHGTAIIVTAGLLNGLEITGKSPADVRIVISGAGAAALCCAQLAQKVGVPPEHIILVDSHGVIFKGRTENMNAAKRKFEVDTTARTLSDALRGADVFYGLSAPNVVTPEMIRGMNRSPLIFAMANPDPEIPYAVAKATRPDAIIATGRSDHPNQINNVLAFPFIFRGALDVQAKTINEPMKLAAARALAELATHDVPECVSQAYEGRHFTFGPEYIIPKPLDPRVPLYVAPAVAEAAMQSGVARWPVNLSKYRFELQERLKPNYRDTHFCGECLYCKSMNVSGDEVL